MAPEKALHCPMCGGAKTALEFTADNGYPIVRCETCRLVFTDARKAPPGDQLYPHFDQTDGPLQNSARKALSLFLNQRAGVVKRVKSSGRLLDYGCGNGSFAQAMSTRGFEAVGLEPFSLGETVSKPGLTLMRGSVESNAKELGTFDVITMWHVLEHLDSPVDTLSKLRALLNPGGVLVISVPNYGSWQSRFFKGRWFHLDPPRHLLHFEADTLKDCLQRAGFRQEQEVPFLPEYGSSGWIQSALNRVLPHQNFIYEFVKDRGALNTLSKRSLLSHFTTSVAVGTPLLVASLPAEFVAAQGNAAAALTAIFTAQN